MVPDLEGVSEKNTGSVVIMKKIGLIVNPIAGMGGRVGLKGTDGTEILNKAIQLGASQEAPNIALSALGKLEPLKDELFVLTAAGDMGENQCKSLGFRYEVVGNVDSSKRDLKEDFLQTDSSDTIEAARTMEDREAELIIFAGGDGTARDIQTAVENRIAVLGIPAGVKIYSPVYGNTAQAAGELALRYLRDGNLPLREEEVVDIDEEMIRNNRVRTELFGYLKVPYKKEYLQNKKAPTPLDEEESRKAIALDLIDHMQPEEYYVIGPGTTPGAVMEELGVPNTLLGIDIIKDRKLIRGDCSEKDILGILEIFGDNPVKLVITPTGGQGYLLGRGNQQISPAVLQRIGRENIIIISTNSKIVELQGRPLYLNTGDESMDQRLAGYYRIKTGYGICIMYRVSSG